jgi:ferredoxin-thioredoxin reductase catalytic chain
MNTKKRFWRCHVCNDIHFGAKPPEYCPTCGMRNAFVLSDRGEGVRLLQDLKGKNVWQCAECRDLHLGAKPLSLCPSCGSKIKYGAMDREEAVRSTGGVDYALDTSEEMLKVWDEFAERNGRIKVWDDRESVKQLSVGVLENVRSKGLRYCPCRVTTGDPDKDMKLICPCNFLAQQTWKEYGECWCGLFVKR